MATPNNPPANPPVSPDAPQPETPAKEVKPDAIRVRTKRALLVEGKSVGKDQELTVTRQQFGAYAADLVRLIYLVFLLALVGAVHAQQYSVAPHFVPSTNGASTTLNGGTNNIAAATTNTYNSVITLTKYDEVALQPIFQLTGAGTSAVVFRFSKSVDGTNFIADASRTISVTAAGTTVVSGISNQLVGAVGYLRLDTIENPNASAVTNLTFPAVPKPSRYGL